MKSLTTFLFLTLGALAHAYDLNCENQCDLPPTCPTDGANPINTGPANIYREITDLETYGTAPIKFSRIYNSRTTNFNDPYWDFGHRQTWQHNWNYEMRQLSSKSFNQFDIKVRYPDGHEYNFKAPDGTSNERVPDARWGDRLYKWSGSTVGYTLVTADGWEYDFWRYSSPKFRLLEVRNGQGLKWTFTYYGDGKLKRISNQFGRWIEIERSIVNGIVCISRVYSNDGREVNYSYSTWEPTNSVVLTSILYPDSEEAAYNWVGASSPTTGRPLLESAKDPQYSGAGAQIKYVYNYEAVYDYGGGGHLVTGTVREERNAATNQLILSLPLGGGSYPQVLEGNGTELIRKYDKGLLKERGDGEGRITRFEHTADGYGYVQSVTEPNGGVTSFERDYAGRVTVKTDPHQKEERWAYNAAGFEISYTDKRAKTTTTTRNALNLPERVDYPDGSFETWTYNNYGQPLTHRERTGGTETFAYYDGTESGGKLGDLKSVTDALQNITTRTYFDSGLVATTTNPRGQIISFSYNWSGELLSVTHPGEKSVTYKYDEFGNRTEEKNEPGHIWKYRYNEYQRLAEKEDPLGRITKYEYAREPGCTTCNYADTISKMTLPSGKVIEYTYDKSGKRTSQTIGVGTPDAATTHFHWNDDGDMNRMTDPNGKDTNYEYDKLHRRTVMIDPLGNRTEWTYDNNGNVLTQKRPAPDSGITTNVYDEMNRLTQTTDPKQQTTKFFYGGISHGDGTKGDNFVKLTDARQNSYDFIYDLLNRKRQMTYPDQSSEQWGYNDTAPAGQIAFVYTARNGATMSCTYDVRGRDVLCDWSDSTPDITKSYDDAGRLLTLNNGVSSLSYGYNEANELISETQTAVGHAARTVSYTYNLDGNRETVTYPGGHQLDYSYTGRNQIKSVANGSPSPLASYQYDLNGNRKVKLLENGTLTDYVYDDASRLTKVDHKLNGTSFARFDYVVDEVGNRKSKAMTGSGIQNLTESYGYDAVDQIETVSYGTVRNVSYDYDPAGNRETVTDSAGQTPASYTANNMNQYTAVDANTPQYDNNGNLTSFSGQTFSYDSDNKLLSTAVGAASMSALYDARRRQVSRTVNGVTTYFIWDEWNLIEERDAAGNLVVEYIHGAVIDEILAKIDSVGTLFHHHDGLGSTATLTNSSGAVVESYTYDVFGAPSIYNGIGVNIPLSAFGNRFLFTGREWIAAVNLYDYRNRVYSAKLGRFLQTDSVGFNAGDVNLYRYVRNNPTGFADALGLFDCNSECRDQCDPLFKPSAFGMEWGSSCVDRCRDWKEKHCCSATGSRDGGGDGDDFVFAKNDLTEAECLKQFQDEMRNIYAAKARGLIKGGLLTIVSPFAGIVAGGGTAILTRVPVAGIVVGAGVTGGMAVYGVVTGVRAVNETERRARSAKERYDRCVDKARELRI